VSLRDEIERQNRMWRTFHEWEEGQQTPSREPASVIADLGAILGWIPAGTRLQDPDPAKEGVRKMIDALGHIRHS
jgi:hypothetical protein